MQDRHNDERGRFGEQIECQRIEVEQRIKKQYGSSEREVRERLATLNQRQARGGLTGWIDRLRGRGEERAALEKTLANIERRSAEMRAPLQGQEAMDRALMGQRHRMEQRDQAVLFARQERAGYEIPAPERARVAQQRNRDNQDRERGFSGGR